MRPRITLRAQVAATVAVAVLGSTVAVTFAAYELERSGTESRFIAAADTGADADLQQAAAAVKTAPRGSNPVEAIADYVAQRGGITWLVIDSGNLDATVGDGVQLSDVPHDLAQLAFDGGGRDRGWSTVRGGREFVEIGSVDVRRSLVEFYDFAPAQQQLSRLRWDLLRLDAVGLLVALLIGVAVAARISRPVRLAAQAAQRFGGGELGTRIPVHGNGELAELATSFNGMARQLSDAVRDLQDAQAQQRRFVADVSHELRTPLSAMLAAGDGLDSPDPELRQRAAALLTAQTRRMSGLVADLLEISRFDAGQASLELEETGLDELVRDVVHTVAPDDDVRLTSFGDVRVLADARRIHTILRNLLGNAVQHGAPPVDILIDGRGDPVVISVADSGPGIDPELVPMIFDRFVRADTARTTRTGSTGLGLAIAHENARLHGAWLTVSTAGPTAFALHLPRRHLLD